MITKAWIILLVDRTDLHRPQGAVSRFGRRTRRLRRAMFFGSERRAKAYLRNRPAEDRRIPVPWGGRWLPVVVPIELDTGHAIAELLDIHAELR